MRPLGRLLQIAGLVIPPVSILAQAAGELSVRTMLVLLIAAVSSFWIGRIVEGYAG